MTDSKDIPAGIPLRHLSARDFLAFGVQQMAYIRPVLLDGRPAFAIHAADGTPLGFHEDEAMARVLTRQNDLEPVQVQ